MQGISLQRVLHFPTNIEISLIPAGRRHYPGGMGMGVVANRSHETGWSRFQLFSLRIN